MSMDEISRVIGGMETMLKVIANDVREIKEGNMPLCKTQGASIERLERRLGVRSTVMDGNGNGSKNWVEYSKGVVKASGIPAILIVFLVGAFLYVRYVQPKQMGDIAKQVAAVVVEEAKKEWQDKKR